VPPSPHNDCGYRRPRFCRHGFLRGSTAEAFALAQQVRPAHQGPGHLDWDQSSGEARTAPNRKNCLSTGNSLQSQGHAKRSARGECLRCANADCAVHQIGQAAGQTQVGEFSEPVDPATKALPEESTVIASALTVATSKKVGRQGTGFDAHGNALVRGNRIGEVFMMFSQIVAVDGLRVGSLVAEGTRTQLRARRTKKHAKRREPQFLQSVGQEIAGKIRRSA
jgi:hypothetical protein